MAGFIDEFTGTKASVANGLFGVVSNAAGQYGGNVAKTLVDEVGGRVGLGVSNAGPDAVASLGATGRTGSPGPALASPHNAAGGFDAMGLLKSYWKPIAGIVVAVVLWKVYAKKKG